MTNQRHKCATRNQYDLAVGLEPTLHPAHHPGGQGGARRCGGKPRHTSVGVVHLPRLPGVLGGEAVGAAVHRPLAVPGLGVPGVARLRCGNELELAQNLAFPRPPMLFLYQSGLNQNYHSNNRRRPLQQPTHNIIMHYDVKFTL